MNRRHVAVVIGTRPEAIKLLPVIRACRERDDLRVTFIATAQHRDMLDQVTSAWGVSPDIDLDVMRPKQDLTDVTTNILQGMRSTLASLVPDVVVLQGDTTTTFAGALASFYAKIPVAHVEAGLRTGQKYAPFPEEINRRATTTLTDLHFAPTERSRQNLLAEGVADSAIRVTGNTGVDALLYMRDRLRADASLANAFADKFAFLRPGRRLVLVTAHRRESFGPGFEEICTGIRETCERWPDVDVVYPVHLNPSVREPVDRILRTGDVSQRVHLLEPLSYPQFVYLLDRCDLVLTDSGGVQEEAPAIGKPVLVMRNVTERPEAVDAGAALLVGARREQIVEAVSRLLGDPDVYRAMARPRFPFGDGRASARIAQTLATTTLQ